MVEALRGFNPLDGICTGINEALQPPKSRPGPVRHRPSGHEAPVLAPYSWVRGVIDPAPVNRDPEAPRDCAVQYRPAQNMSPRLAAVHRVPGYGRDPTERESLMANSVGHEKGHDPGLLRRRRRHPRHFSWRRTTMDPVGSQWVTRHRSRSLSHSLLRAMICLPKRRNRRRAGGQPGRRNGLAR